MSKSASEFRLDIPAACSGISASTNHNGSFAGPGTISLDYDIAAGSGNTITAYVAYDLNLVQSWSASATGSLSLHLQPGQIAKFYLRKQGNSASSASFSNFVFTPDPSPRVFDDGFEGA